MSQPTNPNPNPGENPNPNDLPWVERALRDRSGIRNAGEAFRLAHIARTAQLTDRLVKKTQDGTLGQETDEPFDQDLGESMHIRVGDDVHQHLHGQNQGQGMSTIQKVATAAALLAAGGTLPTVGSMVASTIVGSGTTPDTTKAIDNDTKYELGLSVGDNKKE